MVVSCWFAIERASVIFSSSQLGQLAGIISVLAVRLLSLAQIRVYFFVATELLQKEPFKIIYRQEDPRNPLLMESQTVLLMLRKSSLYHCIKLLNLVL